MAEEPTERTENDLNRNTTLTDLGRKNTYYIEPEKEGSATVKMFMDELENKGNDNVRPVLANQFETLKKDKREGFNSSVADQLTGIDIEDEDRYSYMNASKQESYTFLT